MKSFGASTSSGTMLIGQKQGGVLGLTGHPGETAWMALTQRRGRSAAQRLGQEPDVLARQPPRTAGQKKTSHSEGHRKAPKGMHVVRSIARPASRAAKTLSKAAPAASRMQNGRASAVSHAPIPARSLTSPNPTPSAARS